MDSPQAQPPSRFLDLAALASLQQMRFVTRHRIEGVYSGRHQSRGQGGAGEFLDFREYVEGEDLRRLDWKVLARTGRGYVRLYRDETNLSCTMAIDASGSMRFGHGNPGGNTGSKLQYVQYLATALSHLIGRQQDQVGLAVVADGLREFIPPGGTTPHVQQIQQTIETIQTEPITRLGDALRDLFRRLGRRGVLMVMSDFLDENLDRLFAALRLFRHEHWEVILLHLIHPDEERLPDAQACRFEGLENEGTIACLPADIQDLYRKRFEAHTAKVRQSALAIGCDYRRVSTTRPYLATLGEFLVERAG